MTYNNYKNLLSKVKQQKQDLLSLLIELKKSNKKVIGVGAPAKGITLLNYCKIDSDLVEYITEKAPLKIGKYTPGTHIPVVGDEKITDDKPDYALLLSWNFSEEIMKNLRKNQNYQGKFIIPIPSPTNRLKLDFIFFYINFLNNNFYTNHRKFSSLPQLGFLVNNLIF